MKRFFIFTLLQLSLIFFMCIVFYSTPLYKQSSYLILFVNCFLIYHLSVLFFSLCFINSDDFLSKTQTEINHIFNDALTFQFKYSLLILKFKL